MKAMNDWASETERKVLDEAVRLAPRLGWGDALVTQAAVAAGLTRPEADLLMPHGARDLAALLSRRHDASALAALPDPASLKIRERIRAGVVARLDAARADEAAVRRWAGFMAFPLNMPLALRLVWESADVIWRWAGDVATDENHYSKRAILSGILITTLGLDMGSGRAAALTQLDRSIEHVMAFEKWKAGFRPTDLARDVAGALARMRYR